MQVGDVDPVEVDDADGPDSGSGEVERRRGSEPAGTDDQHTGGEQTLLAGSTDLVEAELAVVSNPLVGGECVVEDERMPLGPPATESALQRRDVRVAHGLQRVGGEDRTLADHAVQQDRRLRVGHVSRDLALEHRPRQGDRVRDRSLETFYRLAHIDDGVEVLARSL